MKIVAVFARIEYNKYNSHKCSSFLLAFAGPYSRSEGAGPERDMLSLCGWVGLAGTGNYSAAVAARKCAFLGQRFPS